MPNSPNRTSFQNPEDREESKMGRPLILDDEKKQLLCSLVAAGFTRARAARQIGCAPSTVTRHTNRDPDFAEQLRNARLQSELGPLGHLRQASSRSWRAAAWLLERQHPSNYSRRNPTLITREDLRETMTLLASVLHEEIRDPEDRDRVHQKIANLIGQKTPIPDPEDDPEVDLQRTAEWHEDQGDQANSTP